MTTINNFTNVLRMVTENTVSAPAVADRISAKFSAITVSVRTTPSPMNRHGNTFQGLMATELVTRPGAIKNIHSASAQQAPVAKKPLYNPLNCHGNTFQGLMATELVTRPGAIKNTHSAFAQQAPVAKKPLYNPLNRHGNTFQGLMASTPVIRPRGIANIDAGSAIDKTAGIRENDAMLTKAVDLANHPHVNEGLYNQANEYATFSSEYNQFAECGLDEHLFDSYPLFGAPQKDSPDEIRCYEEEIKTHSKPFNPTYYSLTYHLD